MDAWTRCYFFEIGWVCGLHTSYLCASFCSKEPGQQRVKRWAFGIDEVLKDPVGREQFLKFLESEFSSENLRYTMNNSLCSPDEFITHFTLPESFHICICSKNINVNMNNTLCIRESLSGICLKIFQPTEM